ncbi:hypothetical protein SAMN05660284_02512 [Formivibrio citricus]|uniref:Uncharacterized protein n=1 Tax=Formivibrio citricus TaxID=83765 RepID=A0A1I5CX75_9NEIS|nr:hypothetical protein [Formivibrio citricus]SFN91221.1 hypothetical protein SAMN05660284_02512 [Formivibrio citricus]
MNCKDTPAKPGLHRFFACRIIRVCLFAVLGLNFLSAVEAEDLPGSEHLIGRGSKTEKQKIQPDEANPIKSAIGFSYTQTIDNPGSKSAGVRGKLHYKGQAFQPGIGQIKTPIGSYHYMTSDRLWDPQGWFPMPDSRISTTSDPITPAMLKNGRYQGPLRAGTPETWCYLPLENAWVAPQQLVMPADTPEYLYRLYRAKDRTSELDKAK